jgi:hypothetical protein
LGASAGHQIQHRCRITYQTRINGNGSLLARNIVMATIS